MSRKKEFIISKVDSTKKNFNFSFKAENVSIQKAIRLSIRSL